MSTQAALPTYEQVMEVPAAAQAVVPPEWIDINEHMNIRHYLDIAAQAAFEVCEAGGVDQDYRDSQRHGLFTVEHHLTYHGEMRLGERLTAHPVLVEAGKKAVHIVVLVLDQERKKVAMVFETVLVHVSLDARRAADFPAEIAANFASRAQAAAALDWAPPQCGIMGIRR